MSTWAYQVENYEPTPDEELVCSVCQGVFNDPVQSHCQHVFCRACLLQWLGRSRTCPVCRQPASARTVRTAPPLVRSLVGKLRVKCPTCQGDPMSIVDAEKHRCPEAQIRCRACRMMVRRAGMADHRRRTCPQRTEQCPRCRLRVPPRPAEVAAAAYPPRSPKHDCIKALKRKLKEQTEDMKEKVKRIKELEERVRLLEEEVSAHNQTSSQSSSSDDELLSTPTLSDDELVINIEGLGDSSSSEDAEDDIRSDEEWFGHLLEPSPPEPLDFSDESRDAVASSRAPKRRRPGLSVPSEASGEPVAHSSHAVYTNFGPSLHTFNRTLTMLQQYNLESDDEWVPSRPLDQTSSESSNLSSSPSNEFNPVHPQIEEPHWISRLLDEGSDDDPDWTPL